MAELRIDVGEEIATAPLRPYHVFVACLTGLIVLFDGYDSFNASYVIHYVAGPWRLAPGQAGLLVSSGLLGFVVAAFGQGLISDRYGRRASLLIGLWIATVFSLATAVVGTSFVRFCVCRFCTGLGLGILLPVSVTYMNEFSPRRLRHTFATWGWNFGFVLGAVAASVVGVFVTPMYGWPALFYVGALSIVLVIVCHAVLPESPMYSAMRGTHEDVRRTLTRLNPERASVYQSPCAHFVLGEPTDRPASASLLLSPRFRAITLPIWVAALCILYAIYGLTGWVPTVMMARGETFSASFAYGALIMGSSFFGTLCCGYLADRFGRAPLTLAIWWGLGAVCVVSLALVDVHAVNILGLAGAGFFIVGGQGGLNNLAAGLYDTEIRGTAVGFMLGVGRAGGTLGPYISGLIQQQWPGSVALFASLGMAVIIGAVSVLGVRPGRPRASNKL